MCGIVGGLGSNVSWPSLKIGLPTMTNTLRHRGPDHGDVWFAAEDGVALGHQRLAIVDLSPAGHQPMFSACGRYVLVFNGEIYNHLELRRKLEADWLSSSVDLQGTVKSNSWRGHSDTETLLAGFVHWGVKKTLQQSIGMFALGLWDRQTRSLTIARDRFGEKPLYYGWQGNAFLFGSELKALKAYPDFQAEIDRRTLCLFLRHSYIPAPYTIYQGIHKLMPGSYLTLKQGEREWRMEYYWSFSEAIAAGLANPFAGTDDEAVAELEVRLKKAVLGQMMADVPLGAFLSGGVDSSTIVALMQAQSTRPIKTFSIGFHEGIYNEAGYAKAVARHLGTEHTELYVTPRQAMDVIPHLPELYDEPFADASQIPTFLVAQLTRQHVIVALSGDAGDELFGGYDRYARCEKLWRQISRVPRPLWECARRTINGVSPAKWNSLLSLMLKIAPTKSNLTNIGHKLHKLAAGTAVRNEPEGLFLQFVSHTWDDDQIVIDGFEPATILRGLPSGLKTKTFYENMMALDTLTYLPDDILVKLDRAGMGVSLESRVPLLDHRLVEYAWRLPLSMKVRNGVTKWALRQVLYKYVPLNLIERPKMGFGVPIDSWLRGPLREWAEDLLNESRLQREGFFHSAPIRRKWVEHLSGQGNWQYHLWDILMFQQWWEYMNC
ncbi:MAG: asparagine synthase (glutamine-hydrolyzing) [Deltaproteobacteria bacterium]|nr:asparagine synthase (glutamine-hydrolyzing) [Deltaproteobacteria bacterium]